VASIGAASFFSDAGHEIATAVLPSFLTGVLRGSAATLGLIEGLSDALLGMAKLVSGPLANQPIRRVQLARGGYLLTAVFTAAIGLATTVWQAGVLRAAAWVARGARTPARDAMLAGLASRDAYGRAFGVERAGDNLGAVVGPLLASVLVATVGIRTSFFFALLPGVLAALSISVAAARARRITTPTSRSGSGPGWSLPGCAARGCSDPCYRSRCLSWATSPPPCSSCGPPSCWSTVAARRPPRRPWPSCCMPATT
jgi:Major Facilitator Superfamily